MPAVRYKPFFPSKDIYIFPASFFSQRGTQHFVSHRAISFLEAIQI